jgi:hypothetical protein
LNCGVWDWNTIQNDKEHFAMMKNFVLIIDSYSILVARERGEVKRFGWPKFRTKP